ncbi:MAG: hypothetical protein KF749_04495 [Bacteroidetes bacterium]|nr:hypothetical protein [Bacteroidota bacterium]MCW5895473.1 hypothetical protein [Bacteroidota bacterium]
MKGFRSFLVLILTCVLAAAAFGGESISLQKAQGEVMIRVGVTETWNRVNVGDVLNPDATVRTGKNSSAVVFLPSTKKRILLPPEVMVDISDMRELTQEELMLKLTMEKVRASSYEWKSKEMNIPGTTVVHGEAGDRKIASSEAGVEAGLLQLNGIRVLYDNGYYSTSALRTIDVLRRYPSLGEKFEYRMLGAQALEKANLKGEALNEFVLISQLSSLTREQRDVVQNRISRLKKQ